MGAVIADVIILLLGIGVIITYAKRGFLKSVLHFFKTILAFVAAYFFGGKLAQLLSDLWIGSAVRNFVYNKINSLYQSAAESFDAEAVIESLPGFLMTDEMQANLHAAQGSGETLVNSMTDAISSPISSLFSNILGYIGVFLIALIGLWIVASILDKLLERISLLNALNITLGALLGVLIAFSVLLIAASLFKFFFADSAIYTESVLLHFLGESSLLEALKFLNVGSSWFAQLLGNQ